MNGSRARDWSGYIVPPFYYLNSNTTALTFNIDSNKISTVDLPKFNIKFDVLGMNEELTAEAAIFFNYKDTLIKDIIQIKEDKRYVLSKPQYADSLLKSISGYVHIQNKLKRPMPDVLLYNMTYIDSLMVSDSLVISEIKENISQPVSEKKTDQKPKEKEQIEPSAKEPTKVERTPNVKGRPVISRDRTRQNSVIRRDEIKKEDGNK